MNTPTHLRPVPPSQQLLDAILPPRPLRAVIELDAELAELQELDRRQWLRDRLAQPGRSISWPTGGAAHPRG